MQMQRIDSADTATPGARVVGRTADVPRPDWNALPGCAHSPFARHEFLSLLEDTGCVGGDSGWMPCHAVLDNADGGVRGIMPQYLKMHSYGEYVFDWAWARAYHQHGLDYYPKLVSAIPFTPVSAPKLLVRDDDDALRLIETAERFARDSNVSSIHALFLSPQETARFAEAGFLVRHDSQFHWINEEYRDFDDYLARFTSRRRKTIRAERRKVREAGIGYHWLAGGEAGEADWLAMYRLYCQTIADHGGMPYLTREFFLGLADAMGEQVLLLQGRRDKELVCSALYFESESTLFGRYWGAAGFFDALHFETCYYQPIERAIERGLRCFEAGAQGLHKLSRGLAPTTTRSAHWLKHPGFYDAVERYLAIERGEQARHARLLNESLPFRRESPRD